MAKRWEVVGLIATLLGLAIGVVAFRLQYEIVDKALYNKFKRYASNPSEYVILESSEYYKLKNNQQKLPPVAAPPGSKPNSDLVSKGPVTQLENLIEEAYRLKGQIGQPKFFDDFDGWRMRALAELKSESMSMDYAIIFKRETQTMDAGRDMNANPYRIEEYGQFLDRGLRTLNQAKSAIKARNAD